MLLPPKGKFVGPMVGSADYDGMRNPDSGLSGFAGTLGRDQSAGRCVMLNLRHAGDNAGSVFPRLASTIDREAFLGGTSRSDLPRITQARDGSPNRKFRLHPSAQPGLFQAR